jgi:hypothetical protein
MTQVTPNCDERRRAMSAAAAIVIETTRRAWFTVGETRSIDMAPARYAGFSRRPMQASVLIALNFWSHKTL